MFEIGLGKSSYPFLVSGGPDRLAASEARARSRGPSPAGRARIRISMAAPGLSAAPGGNNGAASGPSPSVTSMGIGQSSPRIRLNVAKDMLTKAKLVLDRLDHPNAPPPARGSTSPSSSSDTSPTAGESGAPTDSSAMSRERSGSEGASATSTASESDVTAEVPTTAATASPQSQSAPNSQNVSPTRSGAGPGRIQIEYPPAREMASVMNEYQVVNDRFSRHWTRLSDLLNEDPALDPPPAAASEGAESAGGETSPSAMAPPTPPTGNSNPATPVSQAARENQMLFNQVTQVMHYLSHAQHAISDMILNFTRAPPRTLRARPFVIQSMVSQNRTVIIPSSRANPTSTAAAATASTTNTATTTSSPASSSSAATSSPGFASSAGGVQVMEIQAIAQSAANAAMDHFHMHTAHAQQAHGQNQSTPSLHDFAHAHAAMAAAGATGTAASTGTADGQQPTAPLNGSGAVTILQVPLAPIPLGNVIPPGAAAAASIGNIAGATGQDLITNVIRSALGQAGVNFSPGGQQQPQQQQTTAAASATQTTVSSSSASSSTGATSRGTSSSSASSGTDSNNGTPQNNQARLGGQTQPTTSTGTRSTPHLVYTPLENVSISPFNLPHPHHHPGAAGGFGPFPSFDPFLQCNSHHIPSMHARTSRRIRHPAGIDQQRPRSASVPPSRAQVEAAAANNANSRASGRAATGGGSQTASPAMGRRVHIAQGGQQQPQHFSMAFVPVSFQTSVEVTAGGNNNPASASNSTPSPHAAAAAAALDPTMRNVLNQLAAGQGATQDDANVMNMIQGIFGQVQNVLTGNGGGGQETRISQFLDSLPDYNHVAGESLVRDLLYTLASHLTFADMFQLIIENNDTAPNINRLQQPLREFIFSRVLRIPDSPSARYPSAETASAIQRFADSIYPEMESMAQVINGRPDVDVAETIYNYLHFAAVELFRLIVETPNSDFTSRVMPLIQRLTEEFVTLVRHVSSDDIASVERLFENRQELISHEVGPIVRRWQMSSGLGHLRNFVAGVEVNDEDISSYVVTPPQAEGLRLARQRRIAQEAGLPAEDSEPSSAPELVQDDVVSQDDEAFETPRSSPELMDISHAVAESSPTEEDVTVSPVSVENKEEVLPTDGDTEFTPVPPPVNEADLRFPSALLPSSAMGPDMVVGGENWHRALPSDWVPIIARDVQAQAPGGSANMEQGPFSDAYLTTQPAKRRKLAAARKPEGSVEEVIAESIQDAVHQSGVRPMLGATGAATLSDMSRVVARDANLQQGVESEAMTALKRRIKMDSDVQDRKHPNAKAFARK